MRLVKAVTALSVTFACLAALPGTASAETRTLKLYNTHTKERVSITFKKNGRYIPSGLREANRFLRDWRRNEMTNIDPELLDLIWEVYRDVRGSKPIYVVSSYRSPATNNMLRKRSRGVAKNSQHTLGKAMDFYIPGVNLAKLRATGLRKHVGGVGYYPRSGSPFVHMDTGRVRHWPRMSRKQLVKVFPKGRTLHVPTDGKPLKGYKLALADVKSGRNRKSTRPTIVASSAPRTTGQSVSRGDEGSVVRANAPAPTPAAAPTAAPERNSAGSLLTTLFTNSDNATPAPRARTTEPTPPGALPGVRRSGDRPAAAEQPAEIITASVVPKGKPTNQPEQPAVPAASEPAAPAEEPVLVVASAKPNTLDAQRIALETDTPVPAPAANQQRFEIASSLPATKPASDELRSSLEASAQSTAAAAPVAIPAASPGTNAADALAAFAGADVNRTRKPAIGATTLAYASATDAVHTTLPTPRPALQQRLFAKAKETAITPKRERSVAKAAPKPRQPSISGTIPLDEITDPLAGFARLPDKSSTKLISGNGTTRNRSFASLIHPDQRTLKNFLAPGNRFIASGFEALPYGSLRTDRFDGPAVIVLDVTFAR